LLGFFKSFVTLFSVISEFAFMVEWMSYWVLIAPPLVEVNVQACWCCYSVLDIYKVFLLILNLRKRVKKRNNKLIWHMVLL